MNIWCFKLRAFSVHLLLSMAIAAIAAWLVFGFWYPYPYREISGGRELFALIVGVDVALGPLITFIVFNPKKSNIEKALDFGAIGVLQLGALLYGLWSVDQARPVHMVFEYARFQVVHKVDIPQESLKKAPQELQKMRWTQGPTYLSLRRLQLSEEIEMTLAALGGVPLAARPELWQPYDAARIEVLRESRPIVSLRGSLAPHAALIDAAVKETGLAAEQVRYLPLISRGKAWTVMVDARTARPVGFVPVDPF